MSDYQKLKEAIFGKSYSKQNFEETVEDFLVHNARKQKKSGVHKRLGDGDIPSLLQSAEGTMWAGTIYMGEWTPMQVIFDTASDWLMIESYECINCEGIGNSTGEVYNTTKGTMISDPDSRLSQRFYGEAVMRGYEFEDKVCILLTECVDAF